MRDRLEVFFGLVRENWKFFGLVATIFILSLSFTKFKFMKRTFTNLKFALFIYTKLKFVKLKLKNIKFYGT